MSILDDTFNPELLVTDVWQFSFVFNKYNSTEEIWTNLRNILNSDPEKWNARLWQAYNDENPPTATHNAALRRDPKPDDWLKEICDIFYDLLPCQAKNLSEAHVYAYMGEEIDQDWDEPFYNASFAHFFNPKKMVKVIYIIAYNATGRMAELKIKPKKNETEKDTN